MNILFYTKHLSLPHPQHLSNFQQNLEQYNFSVLTFATCITAAQSNIPIHSAAEAVKGEMLMCMSCRHSLCLACSLPNAATLKILHFPHRK